MVSQISLGVRVSALIGPLQAAELRPNGQPGRRKRMRYHGTVVESVMDGWRVSWDETGVVSVHKSNTLKLETRSVRPRVAGPVGMIPTLQPPSLLPPSLLPPSLLPPTNHTVVIPPSVLPPPLPEEEDAEEAPLNNIQFDMELEASEESEESIDEDPDGDDPEERQQFAHQVVEMFEQMFVGGEGVVENVINNEDNMNVNNDEIERPEDLLASRALYEREKRAMIQNKEGVKVRDVQWTVREDINKSEAGNTEYQAVGVRGFDFVERAGVNNGGKYHCLISCFFKSYY